MDHTQSLVISILITVVFWGFYYAYCKFSFQDQDYELEED